MHSLGVLLLLCAAAAGTQALNNGLSTKPALGFNTWNAFRTKISEDMVKETANSLVDLGLKDAGYTYLNLDDGWSERQRSSEGTLVGSSKLFPGGMKALGEYIHGKGLKYGIYSDAGTKTCAGFPGSRGYEELDASTWAEWGVDYLKYDNCHASPADWVVDRYAAMRDALNASGRPIVYSLCEWGVMEPWLWAPAVGNSWRTTEDIDPGWDSIVKILEYNVGLSRFAGPDRGWNDLDMLYVGNPGLQLWPQEERTHFALWSLFKSPLMIGHDLRGMNHTSLEVLKSEEVIAVNQDDLGVPGDLIWQQGTRRIYAGPLSGGARAVVLANFQTTQSQYPISNITVYWEQLGLRPDVHAQVRDLYARRDLGVFVGAFQAAVAVHDVAMVRITPLEGSLGDDAWRPWHQQPVYAPQPANLAVSRPGDWAGVGVRSAAAAGGAEQQRQQSEDEGQQQQQQQQQQPVDEMDEELKQLEQEDLLDPDVVATLPPAVEEQQQQQQQGSRPRGAGHGSGGASDAVSSLWSPPVIVACVAAAVSVGIVAYFVVAHLRTQQQQRGWERVAEGEAAVARRAGDAAVAASRRRP